MYIEVRSFQDGDIEDLALLCNVSEKEDPDHRPLTVDELRRVTLEHPAYDPQGHFVALDAGRLICSGRGIFVPKHARVRGPIGYFEFYIHPDYSGQDVEREVFLRIGDYLNSVGVDLIQTRVDTRFEARVGLLERLGFTKNDYQNHGMETDPRKAAQPRTPPGYRIRVAQTPDELETLVEVFNEAFATRDKYPPTSMARFQRGWVMEDPENYSGFFLAERETDTKVVGMVLSGVNRKYNEEHGVRRGGTYALAVIPTERKKGLGTALTMKSIEWIRVKGMDIAYVSVNVANKDALGIYQSVGYQTVQVYQGYELSLP